MQILKIMIAVFLIFAFLFLPIIIDIGIVLPTKAKKGYFSLRLYGIIPIYSGYVELIKEGFCIHISEKKAKIFPYKNIFDIKNTIKPIKDFQIISFRCCIDINSTDDAFLPIYVGHIIFLMSEFIGKVLKERKTYLKFSTNVNLVHEKLSIYLNGKIVFNVLIIILELFRFILEKIINVFRFQKQ